MSVKIILDKCEGCEECLSSCPYDAIVMKDGKAHINEYCQFCMTCISVCPQGAIIEVEDETPKDLSEKLQEYSGVWIFAEQRDGKISSVAPELLGIGRKLADDLQTDLSAVLFGASKVEADELICWGADKVYLATDPILQGFNDEPYSQLLRSLIQQHKPEIVLAGATAIGRSFIPRVAARLRTGLTADCTLLSIDTETRNILQVRPAFGGNIMATILCPHSRPQMATVRPRVMKKGQYDESRKGEIIDVDSGNLTSRTKILDSVKEISDTGANLQEAEIIISGGRGLGNPKGFEMLEELAALIGGTVGSSRAAVDSGWIPYRHQVGQTGKTVCPKIYIACGISGAVQHLVGMQSSDVIIAINKNPEAPIFNVATYGLVGDLYEIVPLMIKKIKQVRES